MNQWIANHVAVLGVALYVVMAAINSLPSPDQHFEFYPWVYHTLKSLLNMVPPQYRAKLPNQ